jgi:hypothetical protein
LRMNARSAGKVGALRPKRGIGAQAVPFGQVLYDEFDILVLYEQWRYMQGGGWTVK